MRSTAAFTAIALLTAHSPAIPDDRTDIEGTWINGKGDGWIELYIENGELSGRIAGSPNDPDNLKPSRLDTENPDPALRSRALRGLVILTGFHYDDGTWKGGRIYDPNSGNTYQGTLRLEGTDLLKLRGYVGISLFGRTETWRRRADNSG